MAVKRYVLPGILALGAYLILGFIFPHVDTLYFPGLGICLLTTYFIRVCDDILDFEKDREAGKALLEKKWLIGLFIGICAAIALCALLFSGYWWLLPPGVIALQFLLPEKLRNFIKPLFIPSLLICLFLTVFMYTHTVWWIIAATFVADIVILLTKR